MMCDGNDRDALPWVEECSHMRFPDDWVVVCVPLVQELIHRDLFSLRTLEHGGFRVFGGVHSPGR